jgi:hypothetical protein
MIPAGVPRGVSAPRSAAAFSPARGCVYHQPPPSRAFPALRLVVDDTAPLRPSAIILSLW